MIDLKQRLTDILQNSFVSDVHLTVGEPVWYRAMGVMRRDGEPLISDSDVSMLLRDFGINTPADKLAVPRSSGKDGEGFAVTFGPWRLRVDLVYANGRRLAIVMRKLNSRMPTVEEIGLPAALIQQIDRPTGLILITGATGSGKSTTLAALLETLNSKREGHIITIEDPVEYPIHSRHCKVTTREIGAERDASSFDAALRSAMREDPDIIMIGEIRDYETMRSAFSAAETGHLVLSTLHTNSAIKTIDRVLSFFPADEKDWARNIFSSVLNCVMSQTLVRRADGKGRMLAYELMINSPNIASIIREDKLQTLMNAIGQSGDSGNMLMNNRLAEMVRSNQVSLEEALAAAYDPNELRNKLSYH